MDVLFAFQRSSAPRRPVTVRRALSRRVFDQLRQTVQLHGLPFLLSPDGVSLSAGWAAKRDFPYGGSPRIIIVKGTCFLMRSNGPEGIKWNTHITK